MSFRVFREIIPLKKKRKEKKVFRAQLLVVVINGEV